MIMKFRAYEIDSEEMFYPDTTNNNEWFFSGFVDGKLKVATSPYSNQLDYVLMQYTGFHDKEGKEIYIGDVVEIEVETTEGFYRKDRYEVAINDFMNIPVIDSERGQDKLYNCFKYCTVIGNVYDMPDWNF